AVELRGSDPFFKRIRRQLYVKRPQLIERQRMLQAATDHPAIAYRESPPQAERGERVDRTRGSVARVEAVGGDLWRSMRDHFAYFRTQAAQLFFPDRV